MQNSSQPIYYHKDIISFLQNPLIINAVFGGSDKANQVINNLIFNNQVFISKKDLPPIIPQLPFEGIIFVEELRNFILGLSKKTDSKSTDFKTIEILFR